jgi:transposase-like protein
MGQINQANRDRVIKLYEKFGGNVSQIARALGTQRSTVYHYLRKLDLMDRQLAGGKTREDKVEVRDLPKKKTTRYLLTCAQNNTKLHKPVWENLMALAGHYGISDGNIFVASFTYNQNAYGALAVKRGTKKRQDQNLWYDPEVEPYLDRSDMNVELAPGLVWCGRMNTLPTATNPLGGFETYTGRQSGILPHVRLAMQSVFSHKAEATKFNYTTGTVTKMNYIQKRAGIRAERLHNYGALLVEVTPEGHWFVRQLCADGRNRIYDLDVLAEGGKVTTGHALEAITWGDIHSRNLDPEVKELGWGKGGMLDTLRPKHQFLHDIVDFRPRNHHDRRDPHRQFEKYIKEIDGVEDELRVTAELLHEMRRDWCKTIVVDSNHDNALEKWLR